MMQFPDLGISLAPLKRNGKISNEVRNNFPLVETCNNWPQLLLLKTYHMKKLKLKTNESVMPICFT